MTTEHRVAFADARDLGFLAPDSIELAVTSPPYPMIEMWDDLFRSLSPRAREALAAGDGRAAFEAMHRELDAVWGELFRVLKPGGIACINVGDATRTLDGAFQLYPNHARILSSCMLLGFRVLPEIVWRKPTNAPTKFVGSGMHPAGAYVTLEHEWILVLRKGSLRMFGTSEQKRSRRESSFFWEERNTWFSDVWELTGARQESDGPEARRRSGAFPFEIAWRLIHMFSVRGDRVLDPFLGSGTTLLAAMAAGRNGIGVEIDPGLRAGIRRGVREIAEQANGLTAARLRRHLDFVRERSERDQAPAYVNRHYGFPVVSRQEREIILPYVAKVTETGVDAWTVEYTEEPGLDPPRSGELPLSW